MKWIKKNPNKQYKEEDSIINKLADIRGVYDVNRFLNPSKDELFDPYLIKNIKLASERIIEAIENKENVVVSCDPDADGLTSLTIMMRYLKNYIEEVEFIYGERNDGHGIEEMTKLDLNEETQSERLKLNRENVAKIKNADLLIIVDSSSNDVETCRQIASAGVDIIVIDHHDIECNNPHVILVNPQQEGCEYPNKQLSGAGVVFKTIQVIEEQIDGDVDVWQYIDLVAVGMYADVMRVDVLENRYLIMHGLRNMKNVGLVRILKGAKADLYKLNSSSIGFAIAPLLNGVARMGNIRLAIDILNTDDDNIAKPIRLKMQKLNDARKVLQKDILAKYMTNIDQNQKVLVVLDEQSSRGFNGIVAQNLSDTYKRPAIVGRLHKGFASGSFRSYNNFHMKDFLVNSGLIEEAMGHPQAGGFTVKEENLELLMQYIEDNIPELNDREPTIIYDIEIEASEVNEYIKPVEQFNLLVGNGFPKIVARVNNITVEQVDCIGKTQETVKIKTFDDMELIKFRVSDEYASDLVTFDTISVIGELKMNEFYNFGLKKKVITPQIMIDDYRE